MKPSSKNQLVRGPDRLALGMVAASLLVIVAIVMVLFSYERNNREAHIRAQAVSLAKAITKIPFDQLSTDVFRSITLSQNKNDLAYAVVVDPRGQTLNEMTGDGVIVPNTPIEETGQLNAREISLDESQRRIIEMHAPLGDRNQPAGFVRLGYFKPVFGLSSQQIPFMATIALPIFLLTPLFYVFVRREIRPIQVASERVADLVHDRELRSLDIQASGELNVFLENFNRFVGVAQNRIQTLENDQNRLLTSTKVLSYKKSRVETVLESLPQAVMVLDESGVLNFANNRIESFLGISHEQLLGRKPEEWCEVPELMIYLSKCRGRRAGNYLSQSVQYVPPHLPDRVATAKAFPLFSPKDTNELFGTLVVLRDVTEELAVKRQQSEFVAHISHELKTPLNTLSMFSESLLGASGNDPSFRIEAANVIFDEVQRLAALIDNLLNITRIEAGNLTLDRQFVKLKDLLTDAFEVASRNDKAQDLNFQLDLPPEFSPISLDKELLRIAINNLLTNAIKYNKPGGSVILSGEEDEHTIRISVRDTGIGIDSNDKDRIFDKFYRSSNEEVQERSGHGLGLPLAADIIKLHNGSFSVESAPGEGTEFVVSLWKDTRNLEEAV